VLKLKECAHEAYSLFQEGRWVAPLHNDEPPGLGTSKAVTRYAYRQRTSHSNDSAHSGSPTHSGDGSTAESNGEYKYENVQTSLDEYIRLWKAGAMNGGAAINPQAKTPVQPPTSDAFLQGVLTGNWEMPSAEETLWGQGFAQNGNTKLFPSTTPNLPNAPPPVGAYDLPPARNFMEDVTFSGAAPTTVTPPSVPPNPSMIYSGPPIIQQPQLETHVPQVQVQPTGIDAFNKLYGAALTDGGGAAPDFAHQEAIYNAGMWGDLMKNFGFNQ
jgi:hypothetical protein